MVAKPILQLPAITPPLTGNEQVPLVQGGATKRASVNDFGVALQPFFPSTSTAFIGINSIDGGGTLDTGGSFQLVNDAAAPGALRYYGTNGAGTKGWYTLVAGGSVTSIDTGPGLTGGPITVSGTISLATVSGVVGTYGSSGAIPVVTVDAYGRVTSASSVAINTVPLTRTITTSGGLQGGGALSSDLTLSITPTISGGTFGSGSSVPVLTFNERGQLTAASTTPVVATVSGIVPLANGGTNAALTAQNGGIVYSTTSALAVTASAATAVLVTNSSAVPSLTTGTIANRVLRTDGTTIGFNYVFLNTDVSGTLPIVNGGTGATTVSGIQSALGLGVLATFSSVTTSNIQGGAVTNAKLANMAANSVKVRVGTTSGAPSDLALSASQLLGRGSTGDVAAIALGAGLSMSGATLSASSAGFPADGRLTLTSATPVTTTDVTAASTLYYTPYVGSQIAVYSGSAWSVSTFTERSLALSGLTSGRPYDVFIYDNAGTLTLELTAWTNDTTRATALVYQDGILVRSGATTRRYLGTIYTTGTTTTEDSFANRYVWNYYNRRNRPMRAVDTTDSWTYTTATFRQARGSTANQLNLVIGVSEDAVSARIVVSAANSGGVVLAGVGVGINSTSSVTAATQISSAAITTAVTVAVAEANQFLPAGRNYLAWLEYSAATGTTTWYGDNGSTFSQSGIFGEVLA